MERPRVTVLASVRTETKRHATIAFRDEAIAASAPGQFCMVWVPGVDEVPMGVGPSVGGYVTLTIEGKGDCTKALLELPEGSKIGVRGPYGTGFSLPPAPARICFVGGGTGIAPMARGAQAAADAGHDVTIISGARDASLLLLHEYLQQQHDQGRLNYLPCTNDGSFGFHGFTTQKLAEDLEFDYVCACGPEPMMVAITNMCQEAGVPSEASLERYMKCATGICDACTVGPGIRLCVEGPVLTAACLETIPEYGVGHRDAAGVMQPW